MTRWTSAGTVSLRSRPTERWSRTPGCTAPPRSSTSTGSTPTARSCPLSEGGGSGAGCSSGPGSGPPSCTASGIRASRGWSASTCTRTTPRSRRWFVPPATAERDEDVRQAYREAFADHWGSTPPDEQRWSRWYTGVQTFRPDVSWLVLGGEEVAGFLLTYFWEADAAATGVREAYVGQLGVRPGWRRRGLGSLLLAAALRSYRSAGYE